MGLLLIMLIPIVVWLVMRDQKNETEKPKR